MRGDGDQRRAQAGMVGWVARTGLPVHVARAADDPRWHAAIDDPDGDREHRAARAAGHRRRSPRPRRAGRRAPGASRTARQAQVVRAFARFAHSTPRCSTSCRATSRRSSASRDADADALFRAKHSKRRSRISWGDVVRIAPSWLSWSYWVLVVLLSARWRSSASGTVSTYSPGPALIRSTARTSVTARNQRQRHAVSVRPGDRVETGRRDRAARRRRPARHRRSIVQREFETQLRNHMLDPGDPAADSALRTLRLELERALGSARRARDLAPVSRHGLGPAAAAGAARRAGRRRGDRSSAVPRPSRSSRCCPAKTGRSSRRACTLRLELDRLSLRVSGRSRSRACRRT